MTITPRSQAVAGDPRWERVIARDKTADGQFWYSVSTTGVYCRPSCPSRTANPKNVMLHDTLDGARATGFRPCRRCNPDGPSLDSESVGLVAKACRLIEDSEEEPSLQFLADAVGRSPSYFHRMFKAATGLTPKDYAAADKARKVRDGLATCTSVTEAIYDAGFNSSGRFYEKSTGMLGMTPTQYRAGGSNEDIKFAVGQTSLGAILVASSTRGVAAILLGDDPDELTRDLQDRFPKARLIGADREYEALIAQVVGFVEAPEIGLDLPLDVRGTAFQRRVWQAKCGSCLVKPICSQKRQSSGSPEGMARIDSRHVVRRSKFPRLLLARQQGALALDAPAIARDRTVLPDDAVARNNDGDRIAGDRFRHLPRVVRAQSGGERAIGRRLAGGDLPKHLPDLDLIERAAQIQRQIAVGRGVVDHAGHGFDNAGQLFLPALDIGIGKADAQRIFHRPAQGAEFKGDNPLVGHGDHKVAKGADPPGKADDLTHRLIL